MRRGIAAVPASRSSRAQYGVEGVRGELARWRTSRGSLEVRTFKGWRLLGKAQKDFVTELNSLDQWLPRTQKRKNRERIEHVGVATSDQADVA